MQRADRIPIPTYGRSDNQNKSIDGSCKNKTAQTKSAETENGTKAERKRLSLAAGILAWTIIVIMGVTGLALAFCGMYYYGTKPFLREEFGSPLIEAESFTGIAGTEYTSIPENVLEKGWHRLVVRSDNRSRTVFLQITDTKAPTANGTEKTISTLEILKPDQMIDHLSDADIVKVSYLQEPAFGVEGDSQVEILLEDLSGNRNTVTSSLHIRGTVEGGLTVEAGEDAPAPESFLRGGYTVLECTPITEQMLHTPGRYEIEIRTEEYQKPFRSELTVVDSVAPEGTTVVVLKQPGETVFPEEFFSSITDETEVTVSFVKEPDPECRTLQEVELALEDLGGNRVNATGELLFSHAALSTVEARTEPLTEAEVLAGAEYSQAQFVRHFIPDTIGTYAIAMIVDGSSEIALVKVEDTIPPVLKAKDKTWFVGYPLSAEDLYSELIDVTSTSVALGTDIDWSKEGVQTVLLTAKDAAGNQSSASMNLTLKKDMTPPVLYGVHDRNCYVGEPVTYFAEVFAEDNADPNVVITVDKSKVNPDRAGIYAVTYIATDADGNTTRKSCRFTFVKASVTEEQLKKTAAGVMEKITTPDMTRTEKLVAVYDYVRGHITYNGRSDKSDWRKEAMNGFRTGKGDCFTYYATLRALLDQTDIPYMSVTRKGGATRHFWLIVNVGTGWYHLDANHSRAVSYRCFMWTNQQCKILPPFWRFEESIYPEIATELFNTEEVIQKELNGEL